MVAEQLAATVFQAGGHHRERLATGNLTALVGDAVEVAQQQLAWRVDQPPLVVQVAIVQVQGQVVLAVKLTTADLRQPSDIGMQIPGEDLPGVAVVQLPGTQLQGGTCGQLAVVVDQIGAGQVQIAPSTEQAALVEQVTREGGGQIVTTGEFAEAVVDIGGGQRQGGTGGNNAVTVVDTGTAQAQKVVGLYPATVVVQWPQVKLNIRPQYLTRPVVQLTTEQQAKAAFAFQFPATVVQALATQFKTASTGDFAALVVHRGEVAQLQLTGGGNETLLVVPMTVVEIQADTRMAVQSTAAVVQAANRNLDVARRSQAAVMVAQRATDAGV
ncbi:hypothetical protein D3C81_812590 [compost metagenome]